jgi:DNA-binding XRE family transcriptional regulator
MGPEVQQTNRSNASNSAFSLKKSPVLSILGSCSATPVQEIFGHKSGSEIEMEEMSGLSTRGNRVRELRENKLMTQAQLARKARVALRTIHSVEKGMNCRMDTKRKILLALGLRFEDKDMVFPPMKRVMDGRDGMDGMPPTH